jgi:hypothetical protein
MENLYRFVGRHAVIGDREFTQFGAKAEFTEEDFLDIAKKCAFISEADFDALEISPADLARYGSAHYYGTIPQAFADKVEKAREIYRTMRAGFQG